MVMWAVWVVRVVGVWRVRVVWVVGVWAVRVVWMVAVRVVIMRVVNVRSVAVAAVLKARLMYKASTTAPSLKLRMQLRTHAVRNHQLPLIHQRSAALTPVGELTPHSPHQFFELRLLAWTAWAEVRATIDFIQKRDASARQHKVKTHQFETAAALRGH